MTKKKRTPFRPPQNKAAKKTPSSSAKSSRVEQLAPMDDSSNEVAKSFIGNKARPSTTRKVTIAESNASSKRPASSQASFAPKEKLQKIMAQAGMGSRREMEAAIIEGRITVNGEVAGIGDRASLDDRILLDNRPIRKPKLGQLPRILLYHKPEAEIVSRDDPEGRSSAFEKLPRVKGGKWIAIGRLDYNTSGLLIFTTSGELANRLAHPRFEVEREYAVRIMGELTHEQANKLCKGVELDDGTAKFEWLREEGGESANHWYRVMLREGRNREVRRMFEAVGVMVSRLMRVRFGMINLPSRLKRGALQELDEKQVTKIFEWVNIPLLNSAPASTQRKQAKPAKPAKPKERRPMPRNTKAGQTNKKS